MGLERLILEYELCKQIDAVAVASDTEIHSPVNPSTPKRAAVAVTASPSGNKASPADPLLQRIPHEKLREVRARLRQGFGAGEGTPTSLALRWEAWLHQCQRRGDWASAVAFVLLLGFDANASHYVAAARCCISAGCVVEAMPLVQRMLDNRVQPPPVLLTELFSSLMASLRASKDWNQILKLLSAAHQMNHAPSFRDFRIGIEAAAEMRQSNTAFAFLQRIQNYRQQQQLSENDLNGSGVCAMELDSEAFITVMTCSSQTGDVEIVQRTFDELKLTFGHESVEHEAWILLLQVLACGCGSGCGA